MITVDWQTLANLAATQLIQLTALICLVGLVNRLLADRSPRMALTLWALVLAKALTPPLWSSDFGLFSWLQAPAVAAESVREGLLVVDWTGGQMPIAAAAVLLTVWSVGALMMLTALVCRGRSLNRSLRDDRVSPDDPLLGRVRRLARSHGLRAPAGLIVSRDEIGPAVAGISRPLLILPDSLVRRSAFDEIRPVILHELVHADRRDTHAALLFGIVRAVWWFHPLVWWATYEADRLIERCVDLTVVRDLKSHLREYARGLLRVLEIRSSLQVRHDLAGLKPCQITIDRLAFLRNAARRTASPRSAFGARSALWARRVLLVLFAAALLPSLPHDSLQGRCEGPPAEFADLSTAARPGGENLPTALDSAPTEWAPR